MARSVCFVGMSAIEGSSIGLSSCGTFHTWAEPKELARDGINVNAVAPGIFPSRMTNYMFDDGDTSGVGGYIPIGRVGKPSDIVGTIIYLISKAGAFTTGSVLAVDGGAILVGGFA